MKKNLILTVFFLLIVALGVNANPVLDTIGDKTGNENELLTFNVTCTEPDNGTSTFLLESDSEMDGADFDKVDNTTAIFSWTPDLLQEGVYSVNISVSDVNSTSLETIVITIGHTNAEPSITSIPVTEATENVLYVYDVEAEDIDNTDPLYNETLTFSLSDFPDDMTINESTGMISWTPTTAGDYEVVVEVSDGCIAANQSYTITVAPETAGLDMTVSEADFRLKPGQEFSKTLTIENSGSTAITDLEMSFSGSDFNISFDETGTFNLDSGESQTIQVRGDAPIDMDMREDPTFSIVLTVSNSEIEDTVTLEIQGDSQLSFKDLEADYGNEDDDFSNGGKVKDVKPGDILKIKGEVENEYSSNDDIDFDDVLVIITLEGFDEDGDDMDDEVDIGKISASDEEKFDMEFDVDLTLDEDTYTMTLEVEGEDDNGAWHYEKWTVDVEVEREKNEIIISRASLDRTTVSCFRDTDLDVKIINIGEKDEEDVVIEVTSEDLDIDERVTNIELTNDYDDEDSKYSKTFRLDIPDDVREGEYDILVKVFRNVDDHETQETVSLTVSECVSDDQGEQDQGEQVIIQDPTTTTPPTITSPPITAGPPTTYGQYDEQGGFTNSPVYIALLAVIVILLLGVVAYMIALSLKRS